MYFGMNLCQTDMFDYVNSRRFLGEAEARTWARQLCSAVAHLHQCDIVHSDIKLENLFIDYTNRLKIGDFGLAQIIPAGVLTTKKYGSKLYAAPDAFRFKLYDGRAADIWSVGACILIMVCGVHPFTPGYLKSLGSKEEKMSPQEMMLKTHYPAAFSFSLFSVIGKCFHIDPTNRPSAFQLTEWFCKQEMSAF